LKPWKGNAPLAWVATLAFSLAASWRYYSESEFPLIGLRNLVNPQIGWPLALVTLALAMFLSFPNLLSKERMLICAGFSFGLFVATVFYASPVAGIIFAFIGANLVRESRSPNDQVKQGSAAEE
jgi:hypothetical protein